MFLSVSGMFGLSEHSVPITSHGLSWVIMAYHHFLLIIQVVLWVISPDLVEILAQQHFIWGYLGCSNLGELVFFSPQV